MFDSNFGYTWRHLRCPLCGSKFDLEFASGGFCALILQCLNPDCDSSFLIGYDCENPKVIEDHPFSVRVDVNRWDEQGSF